MRSSNHTGRQLWRKTARRCPTRFLVYPSARRLRRNNMPQLFGFHMSKALPWSRPRRLSRGGFCWHSRDRFGPLKHPPSHMSGTDSGSSGSAQSCARTPPAPSARLWGRSCSFRLAQRRKDTAPWAACLWRAGCPPQHRTLYRQGMCRCRVHCSSGGYSPCVHRNARFLA